MAGVYIKGMEMPPFCHVCPMYRIHHTGFSFCKFNNNAIPIVINGDNLFARPEWCPLVEVPDHGDLIDANTKIGVELYDECREEWYEKAMTVWEYLGHASTANVQIVIPAEKEEV